MTNIPRRAAPSDDLQASTAMVHSLPPRPGSLETRPPEAKGQGKIVGCRHMCHYLAGSASTAASPSGPAP